MIPAESSAPIMIIEDHPLIAECVSTHLRHAGLTVLVAESCHEALEMLLQHQPALLVLDTHLDDGSGYDLCRTIRHGGAEGELLRLADLPILLLSDHVDEQDRIAGFRAGADDYLTRPFCPQELLYRIQAIIRRCAGISTAQIVLGSLTIDPRKREAMLDRTMLDLPPKAFDLLHVLASNIGRVFSREELFERVWGYSFLGNSRTVDVHINRLRRHLAAATGEAPTISTAWGVGYKLVVR